MGRTRLTATLLSNGNVLVTGRHNYQGNPIDPVVAELYDPITNTWANSGAMADGRFFHSATALSNGKVLVVGGTTGVGSVETSEIYDPSSETFSTKPGLVTPRYYHVAALLSSGKVLIAAGTTGGSSNPNLDSAELFTPSP